MAIFGKSSVGKTTLMRNMIMADLLAGNGVTVVDPHGSLIDDLLQVVPRHRTNDVIYLNPAHPERVIGLNVLQSVGRHQHSLVVSSIIISAFSGTFTPTTGDLVRSTFLSTASTPFWSRSSR